MSATEFGVVTKRRMFSGASFALVLYVTAFATNVQAASYAVSNNVITNFSMSFSPLTTFTGFTFSSDAATKNNIGTGNAATMDAPAACISCSYSNQFYAHGMAHPDYSYGDARISNKNILLGAGSASAIGESLVSAGLGAGFGTNTMVGFFSTGGATTVNFGFDAKPYLESQTTAGGVGSANINMTVTIRDSANQTVFSWAPNGIVTAGEIADPFNLNYGLGTVGVNSAVYNPGMGYFAASTTLGTSGFYSLNITMKDSVFVSAVPVPAAVWLLGSGLVGLAGIARRKVG